MTKERMRQLEQFFLACSLTCAFIFLSLLVEREWFQYRYIRDLSRVSVSEAAPSPSPASRSPRGNLLGKLDIPRLEISAAVLDGDDDVTLRRAVGHLPQSAYPGEEGRVVLAAHRDTFFRNLRWARVGDVVRMATPHGLREYAVETVLVVRPESTEVIAPTKRSMLTLVTCYPFDYVGAAPYRFIVHASARQRGKR